MDTYSGGIKQLLFGDIIGISNLDLIIVGILLLASIIYLSVSMRAQILLTLNTDLAGAVDVSTRWHRITFIILLAIVATVSIKAVGVLLISAFIVIPACAGQLFSRLFPNDNLNSAIHGGTYTLLGHLSGLTDQPSGPSVVIDQFIGFLIVLFISGNQFMRKGVDAPD